MSLLTPPKYVAALRQHDKHEDTERLLMDFLVWLGQRKLIVTQEMPSGKRAYGPSLRDPQEILDVYWESYQ